MTNLFQVIGDQQNYRLLSAGKMMMPILIGLIISGCGGGGGGSGSGSDSVDPGLEPLPPQLSNAQIVSSVFSELNDGSGTLVVTTQGESAELALVVSAVGHGGISYIHGDAVHPVSAAALPTETRWEVSFSHAGDYLIGTTLTDAAGSVTTTSATITVPESNASVDGRLRLRD